MSALLVLIGHSQLLGKGGNEIFVYLASHAHAAVMIFFVLSGYVIAAAVDRKIPKSYNLSEYFSDRASRIYSVLLPAILMTLILDQFGSHIAPARYGDAELVPQTHAFIRFLVNLLCLQGMWGYRVQFGSNPALWSIGYEFFYYVMYGLYVWKPRIWKVLAALGLLIVGPHVAFYGLIWMLGVLAYRLNKSGKRFPFLPALTVVVVSNHFLEYQPFIKIHESALDLIFGISVMALVMAAPDMGHRFERLHREMAEFSYSQYAYHMPMMFMAFSLVAATPLTSWLVVFAAICASRLLYEWTEKRRGALKKVLILWGPKLTTSRPTTPTKIP